MLRIKRFGLTRGDSVQFFAPALAFTLRHDFQIHLEHARVGALRISEHMQLTHRQRLDELHVLAPALCRLAANADHTVHADEGIRHDRFDMRYALGEQFAGVPASHNLEHRITAALQRYMEVRRKMASVRHEIDDLIAQQVRFAA